MIDTHTHLQFPELLPDMTGILERARAAGVTKFVVPSTNLETATSSVNLAIKTPGIFPAVGMHPTDVMNYHEDTLSRLADLLEGVNGVVSIGEVGLDYYHFEDLKTEEEILKRKLQQQTMFIDMIVLATDFHLPLIIHSRDAFEDTLQIWEEQASALPTVLHCFSGTLEQAKTWLEVGCLLSFTGMITYKKNQELRDIIKQVPLEQIMLETDSPFLAPEGFRGKVCEPMYVREVAKCVAEIKGISLEEVDEVTTENAESFFGI